MTHLEAALSWEVRGPDGWCLAVYYLTWRMVASPTAQNSGNLDVPSDSDEETVLIRCGDLITVRHTSAHAGRLFRLQNLAL